MISYNKSLEESQSSLLQSFNEIAAILKAISHPNRLKILILLLTGPQTFQTLLDEIKLKKSALANHLTHLRDRLIVEKIQHGTYRITEDGQSLLQAIDTIYQASEARKLSLQRYQPVKIFLERKKE